MKKYLLLILTLPFFTTACSSIRIDHSRVKAAKKVAIVGMTAKQVIPNNFAIEMGNGAGKDIKTGMSAMNWGDNFPHQSVHADRMYSGLQAKLKRELKWNVMSREKIENNNFYNQVFRKKTKGLHGRPLVGDNIRVMRAGNILDAWGIYSLKPQQRRQLMEKLNVDALVVADVQINVENRGGLKKLIGAGDFHPQANTVFRVYDKTSDEPIWVDYAASGPEVPEGLEHMLGITNFDKLDKLGVAAAELSFETLIDRYRKN